LTSYFKKVLPDYDEERVYPSDIKKIVNWYNLLQAKGLVVDEEPVVEVAKETPAEAEVAAVAEKPKKVKKTKE
jgi:hypothetical protein